MPIINIFSSEITAIGVVEYINIEHIDWTTNNCKRLYYGPGGLTYNRYRLILLFFIRMF